MTTLERHLDAEPAATEPPELIDLTPPAEPQAEPPAEPEDATPPPVHDEPPPVHGMRIRRVRLRSVAKIASVFFALGFATVVGTLVALWNIALALGVVDTIEESVTTALALEERFSMVGDDLFGVVLWVSGLLALAGWVLTVLLALVYNVACATFGGLAVEVGPLRRTRRMFSLRHRRFVTVEI